MTTPRLLPNLVSERGMALVMSMIALLVLSALVLAFSTLSSTEPTIASNQARVAQARAIAEAGIERATWALSLGPDAYDPTAGALATPALDGSLSVTGTKRGEFWVTMALGKDPDTELETPWRVDIKSEGWVPDKTNPMNPHQLIGLTVTKLRNIALDARCALCVRGGLRVWGTSVVDSRPANGDANCGSEETTQRRPGTFSTRYTENPGGNALILGSLRPEGDIKDYKDYTPLRSTNADDVGGGFDIVGPDIGDAAKPFEDVFDQFALKKAEFATLKALAKAQGTYWGPGNIPVVEDGRVVGNDTSTSYTGVVKFTGNGDIPDGIIFVDTVDGQVPTDSSTNLADVGIHGNSTFNGWIIVNGSLLISGGININGLVFAANDIDYRGTGSGRIAGQMISGNIQSTSITQVEDSTDSEATGNALIQMNCEYVRNGGANGGVLSQSWFTVPGTYKERGQ